MAGSAGPFQVLGAERPGPFVYGKVTRYPVEALGRRFFRNVTIVTETVGDTGALPSFPDARRCCRR